MELEQLRNQIDEIDEQIVQLFAARMGLAAQIARCKQENGLAVEDPAREAEKLWSIDTHAGSHLETYTRRLCHTLFELSRDYQTEIMDAVWQEEEFAKMPFFSGAQEQPPEE